MARAQGMQGMDSARQTDETSIFALSSGAGMAGVAVLRVSGPGAAMSIERLTGRPLPPPRRAVVRRLHGDDGLIDQAMVLWMPGPGSFTGEDVAEFHVHGGRAVVLRMLEVLGKMPGLRLAREGEFTRRAFENGRLSLMEVEGLADLIHAETEAQRRQAVQAASGLAGRRIGEWRESLIFALSRLEAAIDFIDEDDIAERALEGLEDGLAELAAEMQKALTEAEMGEALRAGIRVVLAGAPNVGKSSLLNALARREAAIVAREAGTTRDVIEVRMDFGGVPVILCDTAGLRKEAQGEIERIGQARAQALLEEADIVLWMAAADQENRDIPHIDSEVIRILNKCDLLDSPAEQSGYDLRISVRSGMGLEEPEKILGDLIRKRYDLVIPPMITRERQRLALKDALGQVQSALDNPLAPLEIRAEMLRQAVRALERLIGKVDVEDLLERIFGEFCIGK